MPSYSAAFHHLFDGRPGQPLLRLPPSFSSYIADWIKPMVQAEALNNPYNNTSPDLSGAVMLAFRAYPGE